MAAWSTFGFSQLPVGGRLIPVAGVTRWRGSVLPPTTSGRPLAGAGEIELGAVTMRELGQRRELALLKTLGMTRRQVRAIVAWQTTVTLVIAAVAGIPLGLALGRWAWQAFAGTLGVVPVTAVPALALAAGTVGLLVLGNLLTALPGRVAARTAPAVTLRAG